MVKVDYREDIIKDGYVLVTHIKYYSHRYNRWVEVEQGFPSDGATWAIDIDSMGWWVHDKLCKTGKFADGSPCTNWQASVILNDILHNEKRYIRKWTWLVTTFLFGCDKCRKNGMFRLREK